MANTAWQKDTLDDIVFEGRNKSYGAFVLRRIYDKHMTRGMVIGILFFLLAVCSPYIARMISGWLPEEKEELVMKEVTLAEPPPLDPKKPPPPEPPKVQPVPIKNQIKFVPPIVKKDEEVEVEEVPPTIDSLKEVNIAEVTMKGDPDQGQDLSLLEDQLPPAAEPEEVKEGPVKPFVRVEQMPEFPDGEAALLKYLAQNIKYPPMARESGIQGMVVIQFVVSPTGELIDFQVMRGIGAGCDEEALRVVKAMPKWKPGKQGGRAVPVIFTLPVRFTLK
jgi:protein TonB